VADLDRLLARLRPGTAPRTARLTETLCPDEGCHGALDVRVRRDGDAVVWDRWRPEGATATGPLPDPVRFDGAAYDAELARADADRSWEPPAWAVARLLRTRLEAEPGLLAAWDCRLDMVLPSAGAVELVVVTPPGEAGHVGPGQRFEAISFPLTGEPPDAQADRAVGTLRHTSPLAVPPPEGWAPRR
jgi:hypothetical protein